MTREGMVERTPWLDAIGIAILVIAVVTTCLPVWIVIVGATLTTEQLMQSPMPLIPGDHFAENLRLAWNKGQLGTLLVNTALVAAGITAGKIAVSLISAFAIVYFDFRFRMTAFWLIFISLMLPVEVRIVPTFEVVANALSPVIWLVEAVTGLFGKPVTLEIKVNLLNSWWGLVLPLIASATATFLFRQFFMTIPRELVEASKIDGASPMRFFRDVAVPLSTANIAALAVILFLYGWNQYLWPLLMTTRDEWQTVILGVAKLLPSGDGRPEWNIPMAGTIVAMLPPIVVVIVLQRWFVKGLVDSEK